MTNPPSPSPAVPMPCHCHVPHGTPDVDRATHSGGCVPWPHGTPDVDRATHSGGCVLHIGCAVHINGEASSLFRYAEELATRQQHLWIDDVTNVQSYADWAASHGYRVFGITPYSSIAAWTSAYPTFTLTTTLPGIRQDQSPIPPLPPTAQPQPQAIISQTPRCPNPNAKSATPAASLLTAPSTSASAAPSTTAQSSVAPATSSAVSTSTAALLPQIAAQATAPAPALATNTNLIQQLAVTVSPQAASTSVPPPAPVQAVDPVPMPPPAQAASYPLIQQQLLLAASIQPQQSLPTSTTMTSTSTPASKSEQTNLLLLQLLQLMHSISPIITNLIGSSSALALAPPPAPSVTVTTESSPPPHLHVEAGDCPSRDDVSETPGGKPLSFSSHVSTAICMCLLVALPVGIGLAVSTSNGKLRSANFYRRGYICGKEPPTREDIAARGNISTCLDVQVQGLHSRRYGKNLCLQAGGLDKPAVWCNEEDEYPDYLWWSPCDKCGTAWRIFDSIDNDQSWYKRPASPQPNKTEIPPDDGWLRWDSSHNEWLNFDTKITECSILPEAEAEAFKISKDIRYDVPSSCFSEKISIERNPWEKTGSILLWIGGLSWGIMICLGCCCGGGQGVEVEVDEEEVEVEAAEEEVEAMAVKRANIRVRLVYEFSSM